MTLAIKEQQAAAPTRAQRAASAFGNVYQFTGRRFDDQTGLYYYRNRYYDPRSGRFVSRDPLGYRDAMNVYQYAKSNPIMWLDPYGEAVITVAITTFTLGKAASNAICAAYYGHLCKKCLVYQWKINNRAFSRFSAAQYLKWKKLNPFPSKGCTDLCKSSGKAVIRTLVWIGTKYVALKFKFGK